MLELIANPTDRSFVCLVPRMWTDTQIAARCCSDGAHWHIRRADSGEHERLSIAQWVIFPKRGVRGGMRLLRTIPVRGLSAKLGVAIAEGLARDEQWAETLVALIYGQRESPSAPYPAETELWPVKRLARQIASWPAVIELQ